MMKPINTALVAFGLSGRAFHAPFIDYNPAFKLLKVMERHTSESPKVYPQVQLCRSLGDVLEDETVELVVITAPNALHFSMAKQVLEAGKHVVLEKPFVVHLSEGRELLELAEKTGKMLSVYHNRRWDGDFMTVGKILQKELLGKLVEFESHYDRYRPFLKGSWKEEAEAGGGIFYDLGPHLIDQALLLFGKPQSIFADIRMERPEGKADDAFDLFLDYGGLKVNLRAGMLARLERPRFHLKGTAGSYIKYGMDPQEALLRKGEPIGGAEWGREEEVNWGSIYTSWKGLNFKGKLETLAGDYNHFYNNIAAHLREGKPLAVSPQEALTVMEVMGLAQKSAASGRKIAFNENTAI